LTDYQQPDADADRDSQIRQLPESGLLGLLSTATLLGLWWATGPAGPPGLSGLSGAPGPPGPQGTTDRAPSPAVSAGAGKHPACGKGSPLGCCVAHRAANLTQVRPASPMYSLSGLISLLSACCSITCAVHPAILLTENTGVNKSVGMPR
jgi:hypothetical protein